MRNGFSYDQKWEAVVLLPAYAGLTVHLSTDVLQQYRIQLHHSANAVPVLEDQYSINGYSYSVRQRRGGHRPSSRSTTAMRGAISPASACPRRRGDVVHVRPKESGLMKLTASLEFEGYSGD